MPKQVTWSPPASMARYKNFYLNLKEGEYFPISIVLRIYGRAEFEVGQKRKKKNAEKELSYHTVKELLYK